jgi:hypothetical protein
MRQPSLHRTVALHRPPAGRFENRPGAGMCQGDCVIGKTMARLSMLEMGIGVELCWPWGSLSL